jgi:hypothetical protein
VAREAALIVETLDRHLQGPGTIRLLGGAALTLGYGLDRVTEDVDLLQDDLEVQALIDTAEFGVALEATNTELEPKGLYLTHIWGPEQLILSTGWRERCRPVALSSLEKLRLEVLGPADLIISKLARADDGDLKDMQYLLATHTTAAEVQGLLPSLTIPAVFAETWPRAKASLLQLLSSHR